MQSEQHIRRLARELDLPDQADQVIQKSKYWSPDFCWLFFERCDELIFEDPAAGLETARFAPKLVSRVYRLGRLEQEGPRLMLRALAVRASACRATGDFEQAERLYRQAFAVVDKNPVPDVDRANLLFRVASLRALKRRFTQALELVNEALRIYRRADSGIQERHLGETLSIRGFIYNLAGDGAAAMNDWGNVLTCTDPKSRFFHCAEHDLACGLFKRALDSTALSEIEIYVNRARKQLSGRPRSLPKLKLLFLQGMICMRFGSTRRGEAIFRKARVGFIDMASPFDMALVSVELGRYLMHEGHGEELWKLVIETAEIFRSLCKDEEANRALNVWKETVMARTATIQLSSGAGEIFAATSRALQERSMQVSRGR